MPDLWIPLPFKEPVWRFVGILSVDSGYYVAQFDEAEETQDYQQDASVDVSAFLSLGAGPPAEPVETFIAQQLVEQPWFDAEAEDYANESTIDVTPQLFPPIVAEPVETFASQPHFGESFEAYVPAEIEDYGTPPEQLEFLAPPEVPIPELEAAQFEALEDYYFVPEETLDYAAPPEQLEFLAPPEIDLAGLIASFDYADPYFDIPEETDDYSNDSLDVTPQLFPPFVQEPDSTFAAQPHYGDSFEAYVPEETQDYAFAEQLEFLAPPEIAVPEIAASQPHFGEWLVEEAFTEDYQAESTLDLTAFFFPTAVEPDTTFAAQPLAEQYLWPAEEIEDYLALPEQNEWTAPPEVGLAELVAASELREQPWFPDQETEDYAPDPLEVPALYPATAQEPDSTFAAQPHYGEWFWEAAETEDYQPEVDALPAFLAPVLEPIESFASQPHFGEWVWEEQQTEDYAGDVDVSAFLATPLEAIASGYDFAPEALDPEPFEDYSPLSTFDLAWLAFASTFDVGLIDHTLTLFAPTFISGTVGVPVEYALATDTSAYANDTDSTSEAKVLETIGASGSIDTYSEAKAVDTT